jgi:hypothetical protein
MNKVKLFVKSVRKKVKAPIHTGALVLKVVIQSNSCTG